MGSRSPSGADRSRTAATALIVIGTLFIVVGLVRVSGSVTLAETIAYIVSGGVGGLALVGSGVALRASAQFHDQWVAIDRAQADLRARDQRKESGNTPWTIPSSPTCSSKTVMASRSSS